MLRVLQISRTQGQHCGIALFAQRLASEVGSRTLSFVTVREMSDAVPTDLVLIHHHPDFFDDEAPDGVVSRATCPVVVFAHAVGIAGIVGQVNGVIAMHPGIIPETSTPTLVFPHPARAPDQLSNRTRLRKQFGLPQERKVVGTCGFLRFERQVVEILSRLLPTAAERDWVVQLTLSPWYIESPGLLDEIIATGRLYPRHLVFHYRHFPENELHLRLQACDIVWCWTRAVSRPYASGVASDLYASGTRVVAADKTQHDHILRLPNVVRAPAVLGNFVDVLVEEVAGSKGQRHDPTPISWVRCAQRVERFLRQIGGQ